MRILAQMESDMTFYGFAYDQSKRGLPYGQLLTKDQLLAKRTVAMMDPEFRRRILGLIEASPTTLSPEGVVYFSLTLGESWRDTSEQEREFFRRHYADPKGSIVFRGLRYSLRPGFSPLAPPGSSYHESSDEEEESLAADLFGNLKFASANCARFGLMNFRKTGTKPEEWHHQPVEIPTARRNYRPSNLPVWSLPGSDTPKPTPPAPTPPSTPPTPPPITEVLDMARLYRKTGKNAVWLADGVTRIHVPDEVALSRLTPPLPEGYGPVLPLDADANLDDLGKQRLSFTGDV